MKCQTCHKEFESKRTTAKYCSAKCRKLAFQVSVPGVSVPEKTVESGNAKIKIVPKDEWRRDYLEKHSEFFNDRYEESKGCKFCQSVRKQFLSDFMFCPEHLKFPNIYI